MVLFNDGILIGRELHNKLKFKAWIPLTTAHVEILTVNGGSHNTSSEDVSNNSMPRPPLIHQKSSPLLTYTATTPINKSPRSSRKSQLMQPLALSGNIPASSVPHDRLTKKSYSQHSIDCEVGVCFLLCWRRVITLMLVTDPGTENFDDKESSWELSALLKAFCGN